MKTSRREFFIKDVLGLSIGCVALIAFMSIFANGFASWYNIQNVLKDFGILIIVATGMSMAILLGKIDLSAGSVMSLSAIVATILMRNGVSVWVALVCALLAGALVGLINGYLIGVQHLNHFVTTFATMSIAQGIALVICDGQIIPSKSNVFLFIGTGKIFGIFFIIWLAAIIFAVMLFVMRRTRFGYKIYSVGGSESCSRLSGINAKKTYILTFLICGVLSAVAGICMAGKANSGNATMGTGLEFSAIATVLIGGTPFDGGKGGLLGTLVGGLFVTVLRNGISLLGLSPAWQSLIIGLVILVLITFDVALNERRKAEGRLRVEQ